MSEVAQSGLSLFSVGVLHSLKQTFRLYSNRRFSCILLVAKMFLYHHQKLVFTMVPFTFFRARCPQPLTAKLAARIDHDDCRCSNATRGGNSFKFDEIFKHHKRLSSLLGQRNDGYNDGLQSQHSLTLLMYRAPKWPVCAFFIFNAMAMDALDPVQNCLAGRKSILSHGLKAGCLLRRLQSMRHSIFPFLSSRWSGFFRLLEGVYAGRSV